jgi:hypothetical protein
LLTDGAQKAAAMRKSHEQPNHAVRQPILTPQEFSKRRYEAEAEQKRRQELARKQKQLTEQQHKVCRLTLTFDVSDEMQQQQRQLSSNGQVPQNVQQQAQALAAAQQSRLQPPTQAPATPQASVAQPQTTPKFSVTGGLQNPNVAATLGFSSMGVSPQQAQQFAALKAAGKVPQNIDLAQFLLIQQQQAQRQMLAAQAAQSQAQAQNSGLGATHLSPNSNANGMQASQQHMLAAMQQQRAAMSNLAANNAMAGIMGSPSNGHGLGNGMGRMQINPSAAAAIMTLAQQFMNQNPHLSADQARAAAELRIKQSLQQSAAAAASGNIAMQGLASFANGTNSLSPQQQQALAQQHLGLNMAQQQQQGVAASNAQAQMMAFAANNGFAHPNQAAMHLSMAGMGGMNNGSGGSPTQMFRGVNLGSMGSIGLGSLGGVNLNGLSAPQQAQLLQSHQQQLQLQAQAQAQAQARLSSGSPGLMPARPESRAGTQTPSVGGGNTAVMMGRSGSVGGVSVGASPALGVARLAAGTSSKGGGSLVGSPVVGTPVMGK